MDKMVSSMTDVMRPANVMNQSSVGVAARPTMAILPKVNRRTSAELGTRAGRSECNFSLPILQLLFKFLDPLIFILLLLFMPLQQLFNQVCALGRNFPDPL